MKNIQGLLFSCFSNFLIGAARVFDLGGQIALITATGTHRRTAAQSAADDWAALERDLGASVSDFQAVAFSHMPDEAVRPGGLGDCV